MNFVGFYLLISSDYNKEKKSVDKMQQMAVMYKGNVILCLSQDYSEHTDFTVPHIDWLA